MNLQDAINQMQARPELLAISPYGQVVRLSPTGFLVPAFKTTRTYTRFRAAEILAVTWVVYTEEQLRGMAANEAAG